MMLQVDVVVSLHAIVRVWLGSCLATLNPREWRLTAPDPRDYARLGTFALCHTSVKTI